MAHTNKLRHRPLGILFTAFICSTLQAQSTPHKTIRFTNGQWFDGTHFVRTDFFSIDGVLSKGPSSHLDETVNLNNGYVVPPFGDAHEHNFDSTANTPAVTAQYLKDGIFYAQGMTDVLDGARKVLAASLVDTPRLSTSPTPTAVSPELTAIPKMSTNPSPTAITTPPTTLSVSRSSTRTYAPGKPTGRSTTSPTSTSHGLRSSPPNLTSSKYFSTRPNTTVQIAMHTRPLAEALTPPLCPSS
jgi:hypothetical protein